MRAIFVVRIQPTYPIASSVIHTSITSNSAILVFLMDNSDAGISSCELAEDSRGEPVRRSVVNQYEFPVGVLLVDDAFNGSLNAVSTPMMIVRGTFRVDRDDDGECCFIHSVHLFLGLLSPNGSASHKIYRSPSHLLLSETSGGRALCRFGIRYIYS